MDEEEINELKKIMLTLLKKARIAAEKGNFEESKKLLDSYEPLESQAGLAKKGQFNDLRNAITSMAWPLEGNERMIKRGEHIRETAKKDSLRLIAKLEEELAD